MTNPGALSSWNTTEGVFSLNDEVPKPRPRAWERAPKSPVLARRHGRKVWKRYEAPAKPEAKDSLRDTEQSRQALGDATNTPRPVKRLRLKDAPKAENDGKENKAAQYFTTLRDKENAGTPRRKQARRKSRGPENVAVKTQSARGSTARMVDEPEHIVQEVSLCAQERLASEDVGELLSSSDDAADAGEITATSLPERLDEIPRRDADIKTRDATTLSEAIVTADEATTTDDKSFDSEAETSSEVMTAADEADMTDNDDANRQLLSRTVDDKLLDCEANPEAVVTVPSVCHHEETENAEGAVTAGDLSTLSTGPSQFPSAPESVPMDNAGVPLSALKNTPKVLAEGKLILEPPSLDLTVSPSTNPHTPKRTSPRKRSKLVSSHPVTTPDVTLTPKLLASAESLRPNYPGETPQIGTSLLRRESLRQKESPSKKRDARKTKTSKKRDTLQRRDTLQEREILQKVIAETTADHSNEYLDAPTIETSFLLSRGSAPGVEDSIEDNAHDSPEHFLCEDHPNLGSIANAEALLPTVDEIHVENDLHRAMEAIDVYEHSGIADASQPLLDVTLEDAQGLEAMDKANEVLAKTEIDDVSQATEGVREQTPNQKTRSGARFSDDTSMLKDFLNRAQARKAAQKPVLSAPDAPMPQQSPRRSPRKMHGSQDVQTPTARKPRSVANRPNTPPSKPKTEVFDSDDGEEHSAEPASCRRSTRTRLPAPSKALPGAPSFIPVRRADGTDPVVLQKSQAQELAVTTRANTRRNKGSSKPPLLALQDLPPESTDQAGRGKAGVEKVKSVAWAERLASYRNATGEADEIEERRPKVRRVKGLGAGNGTPAAKRTTAAVSSSNGTPAPKRRGKV